MELGQGALGRALEQGRHQPVGQGLGPGAAGRHGGRLQVGAGHTGVGRQGGDARRLGIQPLLQLQGEHHIGQLALAVGLPAVVAALALQVIEADAAEILGAGGDGDHPGIRLTAQQWQQCLGEGEVAQVIDAELALEAIAGEAAGQAHHPGVVDQQIEAAVAVLQLAARGTHGGQVGQIKLQQVDRGPIPGSGQQLLPGQFSPLQRPASQDHRGPLGQQRPGCFQAEAAVSAGDQRQPTPLVWHIGGCPGHRSGARERQP